MQGSRELQHSVATDAALCGHIRRMHNYQAGFGLERMRRIEQNNMKAKPFIKWVGGKGQLLDQLEALLPNDFDSWADVTYIEPFVGGGAMLFHLLQAHPNIRRAVINDINPKLTTCYRVIRDNPQQLITRLKEIENYYLGLSKEEDRRAYYMQQRAAFNGALQDVEQTAVFIFLNRTCFNGLYRENRKGEYNVPFGRYANPQICNAELIMADNKVLQRVEILTGDFRHTLSYAQGRTLFYFDPPYRPLSNTSSFNDYAKQPFNDEAQIRLKEFCDQVSAAGCSFMLSNSDCLGNDGTDRFFDDLFQDYYIERVWAKRSVNAVASKRGKLTEILVHNYNVNQLRNAI